ncbi:uncharacterized protein LOC126665527 isoform X2 [Mercurialis annua]|nr:uncharacterized protein LOC126665527 isoform X2 [Mercurialis annua]
MPEKRMLQLILDVLQRRDTHEIFAEPVDTEVEDYYEIIKEPMDFGTMRAKLHEGMYKNLEQFEYDVFLISKNAMHFNSTSTIFFRQARAIDELAKKVFHVLKTDPESFESEFSGTRRRTNRRPKCEVKSSSKLAANYRSNSGALNVSRTPVNGIPNLRTTMQYDSVTTMQFDLRDDEVPFAFGDGRGSSSYEADRRSTYRSSLSDHNENLIVSTVYSNSKLLMHINQQDNSYRNSLMSFVKDLGPTAQMVAERKLNGWSTEGGNYLNSASTLSKASNCKNHAGSNFGGWIPAATNMKSQNVTGYGADMHDDYDKREKSCSGDKMGIYGTFGNGGNAFRAIRQEEWNRNDFEAGGVSKSNHFQQNQSNSFEIGLPLSNSNGKNLHFTVAGLNSKKNSAPLDMEKSNSDGTLQPAFDYSQQNIFERRLADKYSYSPAAWSLETAVDGKSGCDHSTGMDNPSSVYMMGCHEAAAARDARHEIGRTTETEWTWNSNRAATPVSQFIFDLPFLKARLDEMNCFGEDRLVQESSARMNETYHDNTPHYSLDAQLTPSFNLALQL